MYLCVYKVYLVYYSINNHISKVGREELIIEISCTTMEKKIDKVKTLKFSFDYDILNAKYNLIRGITND